MKKIIIFASGTKEGGGSGFQTLVEQSRLGLLEAEIAAVVSNHEQGGVRQRAEKLGVRFVHYTPRPPKGGDRLEKQYCDIVEQFQPDLVCLSGWLKPVRGLDPRSTINIHPGPLPRFGGQGMYGHHVHEAVMKAYHAGEVHLSGICMHFVTEDYDEGPVFFRFPVLILPNDTVASLGHCANQTEHDWQAWVTNLVVRGEISWDGVDPTSLKVPDWYKLHQI